jgi:protein SCO1/2
MLRVLVVALVLLVAAMVWMPRPDRGEPPANATILPQPRALPEVALIDQTGADFRLESPRGELSLLFFGFTNCPDVCPLTLEVLADARAEIAERVPEAAPRVVFVSVDPSRDTPERIDAYLRNFDPDFIGVTAADDALAPLLKALGVTVEKHEHGGASYNVVHNSTVYVLGPDASLVAVSGAPHDAATIAADYLKIRARHRARPRPPAA